MAMTDAPTNGSAIHAHGAAPAMSDTTAEIVPISPVDNQPLEPVRMATEDEVCRAVAQARAAEAHWRAFPLADRVSALRRAAKDMLRWRAAAIDLARVEMGKVDAEGLFNEALGPLDAVRNWGKVVERATRRTHVRLDPISFPRKHAYVDFVPRGVVGIIAPWNFPIAGLYRSTLPALLTGNAIVLKPSEYTPRTSAWLAERLAEELPDGLIQVVQGDGRVGRMLIDAGIDACVFTGSVHSGRSVRIQCAERAIPASIEMGGKDPAIVLTDCDLPRTVAGITHWALSNAGQACGAIEIAYVDEDIADRFVDRVRSAFERLRTGPGDFSQMDVGPLANQRQLDLVAAQVEEAKAKGAKVLTGGQAPESGLFYPPTLLDRCDESMSVVRDETFGPVLAVIRTKGAMDAIRRANRSRYGLGASIWTSDLARGKRLAEQLEYGVVTINNHAFTGAIPALPWTGTRDTGFGIANGPQSLATFVRPHTTVVDKSQSPELFWMPYDQALRDLGESLADAQIGRIERAWRIPLAIRARIRTVRAFFR